jgi:hypothetical protein
MIVSQRPVEIDETILSQCGTFIALRLTNASDRGKVQSALPDSLAGIIDSLPVLRTGEAIIVGEAARLPIRCRVTLPSEERRPNSGDPEVAKNWKISRIPENYVRVASSWRAQDPKWTAQRVARSPLTEAEIEKMERENIDSSTILSVGYDGQSEILEVEFKNGGIYQYYNVPQAIFEQFMESSSKGSFLHANIKSSFPYSKV